MLQSKRAMSPLIATVFLIAFAVALGVMIMNWNPEETETHIEVGSACSRLKIEIPENPCYNDNTLTFTLRNSGQNKINAIKIKSVSGDIDSEQTIKSSSLIATETLTKSVPFLYLDGMIVSFIPMYLEGGELISCDNLAKVAPKIESCS